MPEPAVLPLPDTRTKIRKQPPYAVILHNDDDTSMQWVVTVLRKVFGYNETKCVEHMMEAHETGRSVVWVGALELAELKADQIVGCGAEPGNPKSKQPIRVTVEPTE
jgi:ATP-dependent Clp protease adaptor protein ClpS